MGGNSPEILYCGNVAMSLGGDIKAIAIGLALKQIATGWVNI
jgi:hypothetical protein